MITSQFPGLFNVSQLEELDHRDLQLWTREAKKLKIVREADAINTARYGQACNDDYMDKITSLEWGLQLLESEE